MITRGSRYKNARVFIPDEGRSFRFGGIRPREIGPATGVVEHIVKEGDRLDLLALHYYNDSHKWWRILDANPEILYGGDLPMGRGKEHACDTSMGNLVGKLIFIPRVLEHKE